MNTELNAHQLAVVNLIKGANNYMMLPSCNTRFRKIYRPAALWAEVLKYLLHLDHRMKMTAYSKTTCLYQNLNLFPENLGPLDQHTSVGFPNKADSLQKCLN